MLRHDEEMKAEAARMIAQCKDCTDSELCKDHEAMIEVWQEELDFDVLEYTDLEYPR